MSVLVTGGAGYIGAQMVRDLVSRHEQVVVIDDLSQGADWAVAREATLIVGDIGDRPLVAQVIAEHRVDAIVHFAGSIVVADSVADPLVYYHNNTAKALTLIAAAVAAGVEHFIFSSTAAVYGEGARVPVFEDANLAPASPYGRSKMMVEMMLRDAGIAHDLRYTVLRYFNVAGADPAGHGGQASPNATHLIKIACQAATGQRSYMDVFGTDYDTPDGTGIRDYIHVQDLTEAHMLALAHLRKGGDNLVLNCGYGRGASVLEVIAAVKRASGVDFAVREAPRRAGDVAVLVAGAEAIRSVLGWKPRYESLDTIVTHALVWEKKLRDLRRD